MDVKKGHQDKRIGSANMSEKQALLSRLYTATDPDDPFSSPARRLVDELLQEEPQFWKIVSVLDEVVDGAVEEAISLYDPKKKRSLENFVKHRARWRAHDALKSSQMPCPECTTGNADRLLFSVASVTFDEVQILNAKRIPRQHTGGVYRQRTFFIS